MGEVDGRRHIAALHGDASRPIEEGQRRCEARTQPCTPWQSAATSEPSLADGVTRFLTFDEEFFVSHDGLAGVVGLPVLDVSVIVGNADHRSEEHTSELQSRQYLVC